MCVLQLTQAGDIFYQILEPEVDADGANPGSVEGRVRGEAEAELSGSSLSRWKRWLAKLMRRRQRSQAGPRALQHVLVDAADHLHHCSAAGPPDPSEKERVERLQQELCACMSERSLLVGSSVSASLGPPEVEPLLDRVEADAWTDPLSRRLTASWQGEEAWRSWWREELGLDHQRKVEDLKRRRRREKEARRAARRPGLDWSDSFSSSASCLSEWNHLSDAWSDAESTKSQRSQGRSASPVPMATSRDKHSSLENPSTSCPPVVAQTPAVTPTRKRSRDTLDSYLSSLLPPQVR